MGTVDAQLNNVFVSIARTANQEVARTPVYASLDYTQIVATFLFAFGVLLGAWILFEYLAQHESARYMFRQRLFHPKCVTALRTGTDGRESPPDVITAKSVLFGAFHIPNDKLSSLMGPGAYLTYRLMRHCTYFSHVALVYTATVLLPLFLCQSYENDSSKVDILGMASVSFISPSNPSHTWVVILSAYIMSGYWVLVVYSEWQHVKAVRLSWEHDSRSMHLQSHYSLMIEQSRGDRKIHMRSYLARLLGKDESEVAVVSTAYDTVQLDNIRYRRYWSKLIPRGCFSSNLPKEELIHKYDLAIATELERLKRKVHEDEDQVADVHSGNARHNFKFKRITGASPSSVLTDVTTDSQPAKSADPTSISATTMRTTSNVIETLIRLFRTRHMPTTFVTLRSMTSRTVLAHMYKAQGDSFARLTLAAPPSDIVWKNVTVERKVITARKALVRIALMFFGIFYAIPLIKIQDFARSLHQDSPTGSKRESGTKSEFGSAVWRAELVSLYLPAIMQVILTQLLPRLFRFVSLKYERFKTYKDVSRFVLHRAFIFQLLTIYVVVFYDIWFDLSGISGGVVYFVEQLVGRFRRLGQEIPPVALYFASVVIINLVTETAAEMINPGKLLWMLYKRVVKGDVDAYKKSPMIQFRYSSSMTTYMTILNIMFTFSLIAPVVVLICWLFLCISYVWNTYAFIYLNNRKYEVGTAFSATIYSGICASLIFSQIALFFVFWSYDNTKWTHQISGQVYSLSALIVLLILFKYVVMRNFNTNATESTSLSLSSEIDRRNKPDELVTHFHKDYYYQPEVRDPVNEDFPGIPEATEPSDDTIPPFDVFEQDETTRLINESNA